MYPRVKAVPTDITIDLSRSLYGPKPPITIIIINKAVLIISTIKPDRVESNKIEFILIYLFLVPTCENHPSIHIIIFFY